jgi:vancomycin resistance protein YoaR
LIKILTNITVLLLLNSCLSTNAPLIAGEELLTISSFTTSVEDQDFNVKTNIALAAGKLNGTVIQPGEVFSFNKTVGDGSAANGFLTGRVLYQDTTAYESGGGICQVSSTLFNAMLLAGCTITERHRHSRPVRYVPLGLDATIRYGKKDLRMKNTTSRPLFIFAAINDKSFTIILKSERKIENSYEVYTEEEEVNLPFANDENRTIRPGISIYVYRKKLFNNSVLENLLLYKDFYPPVNVER